MLKLFTRLEKTRNFVLLIFAVVMVVSLVIFYAPTPNTASANLAQSQETAASVKGLKVTVGDIVRQKENYGGIGRGFPTKMVVDNLIDSRIVRYEAERLGLTGSDAEVAAKIREMNKTEDGRPFDREIYERNVTEQFGSISTYEQAIRDNISAQKLSMFVTAGVTVSEEEVLKDFQKKNTKFDVAYVTVNSSDLAKSITPSDEELRDYFEKNKQSYYISVPQKKIRYVFLNTTKIGEKLQISEADIKAEFDALPADKRIAGVLGREIVLRVSRPDFETQVQAKAQELVERLRQPGTPITEDTFAELAKGHSENPATAPSGGKLSGPVRENPSKPDDPYQRLLKMKPGEITDPISYEGRYFILYRGEDVPKTFETARRELEISLRNRRAYTATAELAEKVVEFMKDNKDATKAAQQFASQANMSVAEMVRETDYVKPGDDVPNIGISPQFEEGIRDLENVGDLGQKTPIQNGFAIPMLVDKKEPRDAEFAEVRSQIVDVVKLEKARSQVDEIARQIASGAASPAALSSAASAKGLTAKDQKNFILGSPLGEGPTAGTSEELENAVFAMKAGDVTRTPIKVGDNWYIVGVKGREDASMDEFAEERSSLMEQMTNRKRSMVFTDYLAGIRRRMESNGDIRVYKEAIDRIDAQDAGPSMPPIMPQGFPPPGMVDE